MTGLRPYAAYLAQRVGASFWFLPGLILFAGIALSALALIADRGTIGAWIDSLPWLYKIGAEGSRLMLSTIAGSMITAASLVFSLTLIALTLASQQLGPRVISYYMQDRVTQIVLGVFLATFVYALLILRTVEGQDLGGFVPKLSIFVALLLSIASFVLLIYFIHHTALFIQADFMLARIAAALAGTIESVFPERSADAAAAGSAGEADAAPPDDFDADAAPVATTRSGYVQLVSRDELRTIAEECDVTIRLDCHAGHFIIAPLPVATVRPAARVDDALVERIRSAVVLGPARTPTQDVEFMMRAIADIVLRALSPSLNDPHTAMAGIDRLGQALAAILLRDLPTANCRTTDGARVAVYLYPMTLDGLFHAALQQVFEAARGNVSVGIHLLVTLTALARIARTDAQRATVRARAGMVMRMLNDCATDPAERAHLDRRIAAFDAAIARGGR